MVRGEGWYEQLRLSSLGSTWQESITLLPCDFLTALPPNLVFPVKNGYTENVNIVLTNFFQPLPQACIKGTKGGRRGSFNNNAKGRINAHPNRMGSLE
ncbi:MAG TPA: hypothetical protein DCY12_01320 [Candidatus Atribacteria bacterium]|nr:hypothetical protein [Candidatus Atribacteria bacterium]